MQTDVQHELIERFRRHRHERTSDFAAAPMVLPAETYTSRERLVLEREALFRRRPVVAALTADLPEPGDALAADLDGVPLALIRGADGRVRCFLNACRHRGAPIVAGRQHNLKVLTCPFHAWSYGTDGHLVRQPLAQGCFDVDARSENLHSIPCDEVDGLVLVRLDGRPFDGRQHLAGVTDDLASFGLAGYRHVETRTATHECNWKMVVDTFLETYHIFSLHQSSIAKLYYSQPHLYDAFGPHIRAIGVRRSIDDIGDDRAQWTFPDHATIHYLVFPNVFVVHQLDHFETWRIFPDGDDPNRSAVETAVYATADTVEVRRGRWLKNLDILLRVTNEEDFAMCAAMHRNLRRGAIDSVVIGRNEAPMIHFHTQVLAAISESPAARQ